MKPKHLRKGKSYKPNISARPLSVLQRQYRLEGNVMKHRSLWDWIIETRDLHNPEGEAILELIGRISNVICHTSWKEAFKECAIEFEIVEEMARSLPDGQAS